MSAADAALVARVVADDDRHAFAALLRAHSPVVRGLLRRLCAGDAATADDLAQETFLRAYKGIAGYKGSAKFSSWLYRIAYNVFLDHAARKTPQQQAQEAESVAASDGAKIDLDRALAKLRYEERALITFSFVADFTHEELAELFALPLGTVKSHIQRGRERLKFLLEAV